MLATAVLGEIAAFLGEVHKMKDEDKKKDQLIKELTELRQRLVDLEASEAERRRAEQMLAESEAKYRALVDQAPVGVIQTSASTGEIFFVNDAALRMFEFDSKEEFLAQRSPTRWKHPEERERFVQLLREHGEVRDFETEALTKTDQTKTVIISSKANGDWLLSTVLDITERKSDPDCWSPALDCGYALSRQSAGPGLL